jgi:hypothetical protein
MLIIIVGSIVALALTYLIVTTVQKTDPNQLRAAHYNPVIVGVQIICGDCAGDSPIPVKTYLDRLGHCSQCGGRSYLLASSLALYAENLRYMRMAEFANASSNGRVIPFEASQRTSRSEKIAV